MIANDTAAPGVGIGKLISAKLVRKVVASHIGLNPETQQQMMGGDLLVDLVPQGTLDRADSRRRIRAWWRADADRSRHRGRKR